VKLKKNNVLFSYKAGLQVGLGPKNTCRAFYRAELLEK